MIDRTVLLSANLLEHVEPWQAVRILRHLKNNALGRWIVLTCPVTIDKDDHDLAARSPGTVSGEFTGLDHKCAPGVEMFLKLGPVGGSVVVAPGGYVVAFYDATTMTDFDQFISSTTVFEGRFSRGDIYKELRESLGRLYSTKGLRLVLNHEEIRAIAFRGGVKCLVSYE